MTEMLRQSLSAVIDDEADAFELRRVLDELDRDPDLRGVWARYHLIGAHLRGEREVPASRPADGRLRDLVWQALAHDVAAMEADSVADLRDAGEPEAADPPARRHWAGRVTALAVAASVAFAVVIGFDALRLDDPDAVPQVAAETAGPAPGLSAAVPTAASGSGTISPVRLATEVSASDVRRAQAYMLHHAQQQALNQAGVMSLVKMATYEKP
jgi:sigma-E factor negative regulatory protein RseA